MLFAHGGSHRCLHTHDLGFGRQHLGQAEIQHLHLTAVGDKDVGRLNIPVDDALCVRGVQRIRDLDGYVE